MEQLIERHKEKVWGTLTPNGYPLVCSEMFTLAGVFVGSQITCGCLPGSYSCCVFLQVYSLRR